MATREIKTRFKLEGEQEFKRAMSDAANATKVLDSEMKLAKAQFEQTGDAEAYAAEQARILKEKIEEQKGAVAAAQAAMNSLAANGVSKNDKTYQMWAQRLNTAKTTLTELETQLGKAENGFEDVNEAANSTDSKLDDIDKELRFQNTLKIVENLRDRLNNVARAAARAGKAIWDAESDAGQWADNLATAASQAGMDVETYQAWQYASRFIDTSVDDISKSVRKMESDLKSGSDDVLKTFNILAVATRNADGSVRDATDVFWDTVDALGRVEDATQRGIYAQTLLGSHYNTLNPLIEAGSKAYKDMAAEGMEVSVVSEENVAALASLNDAQEKLNASLEKAKFSTLAELAPTFEAVSKAMGEAVQSFNEFVQSEEGQAALSELNEALSGVIKSFLGEDNGKGTFQAIVEAATGAVNTFTDALSWIRDNADTVKTGLMAIAGVWAGLNVAPPVLEALHLIQKIDWGKVGGNTAGSAASAAAGSATSGSARDALRSGATAVGGAALHAASKAESLALAAMAAEVAVKAAQEVKDQGTLFGLGQRDLDGAIDIGGIKIGGSMEGTTSLWDALKTTFGSSGTPSVPKDAMGVPLTELEAAKEQFEQFAQETGEKGQQAADNFAAGITENAPAAAQAADDMGQQVNTTVEEEMSFMEVFGNNAAEGFAQGIYDRIPSAVAAAQEMANQVQSVISSGLDIHSPSRVLMRLGQFTAEGFAEGIDAGMARVEAATARMGRAAMAEPTYRSGGSWGADPAAGQGSQQSGSGGMNATIVMDKTVVGQLVAPIVNDVIGASVASSRRY